MLPRSAGAIGRRGFGLAGKADARHLTFDTHHHNMIPGRALWCKAAVPLWLHRYDLPCTARFKVQRPGTTSLASVAGSQGAIQVIRRADQGQMGKGLGEIPQRLPAGAGLLRVQPQVISVP